MGRHCGAASRAVSTARLKWVRRAAAGGHPRGGPANHRGAKLRDGNDPVRNPRNGQFDYQFTPPGPEALQGRARELRVAQREWSARPVESRVAILQRWKARLLAHRVAIVEAVTVDTGRHLLAQAEFGGTLAAIDRWCAQAPGLVREDEGRSQTVPSITYRSQLVPYALVGVISPGTFPLRCR
jgi:acyl-CoA reductase-like NAD-dependent aldehyde dehydrogenase